MSVHDYSRRDFLRHGLQAAGGLILTPTLLAQTATAPATTAPAAGTKKFQISFAAWSVHRMFYADKIKQIDFPELCRKEFDIGGLELVNSFFPSPQYAYCKDLRKRADDHGVKILLVMCDGEGDMCHRDPDERRQAVRNHRKWLDAAHLLGCHSIRCNASGAEPGDPDAVKRCAESFAALVDLARPDKLNVIIENHWGFSSNPDSLLAVLKEVNDPLLGTLPDFGNFPPEVDRYEAVRKLMPYAKGVSAKCYAFDPEGNETTVDYARMMPIVLDAGYHGFVGIEYEGKNPDEIAGVKTCKRLLERFQ